MRKCNDQMHTQSLSHAIQN